MTRYIDAAVAQLRAEGHEIRDEDVARLSPLKHKNLNVLGRYSVTASTPTDGGLRPLRDPDALVWPSLTLRSCLDRRLGSGGGERGHLGSRRSQRARRQRPEAGQVRDKAGQGRLSADETHVLVRHPCLPKYARG
jgi:hypothetical protein